MTGEAAYYDQIRKDYINIYGAAYNDAEALQMDLAETEKRLKRLQETLRAATPEKKESLKKAVKAHEAKIFSLKESIQKAEAQQ
jgi:hypothetical protein